MTSNKDKPLGDNVTWSQPEAPPPRLFLGRKEKDYVKQVNDEVIERVVGQTIAYYPISQKHTNYHELYGEAIHKTFLPPVRVHALVEWEGAKTTTTNYGIDNDASIIINFHKRRLTDDQDLYVREGDMVRYGDRFYEIVKLEEPRELFGYNLERFEIQAKAIRARKSLFMVSEPGAMTKVRQLVRPSLTTVNVTNVNIEVTLTGTAGDTNIQVMCPESGSADQLALIGFAQSPELYPGKIIYLSNVSGGVTVPPFHELGKFYFNENGEWFRSPFLVEPDLDPIDPCTSSYSGTLQSLSADPLSPDFPTILDMISSSGDYVGDIVYITEVGTPLVNPFNEAGKYYFNENAVWHKSPFDLF